MKTFVGALGLFLIFGTPGYSRAAQAGQNSNLNPVDFTEILDRQMSGIEPFYLSGDLEKAAPQIADTLLSGAKTAEDKFVAVTFLNTLINPDDHYLKVEGIVKSAGASMPALSGRVLSRLAPWVNLFESNEPAQKALASALKDRGLVQWRSFWDGYWANGSGPEEPEVYVPSGKSATKIKAGLKSAERPADTASFIEAAGLIHDLKGPLTVILGGLSAVQGQITNAGQKTLLEQSRKNGKRFLASVDNWLSAVKNDEPGSGDLDALVRRIRPRAKAMKDGLGKLSGEIKDPQLKRLVERALTNSGVLLARIDSLRDDSSAQETPGTLQRLDAVNWAKKEVVFFQVYAVREANLHVSLASAQDMPAVMANEDWASRILLNLLINAFKFSSKGSSIKVRIELDPQNAGFVRYCVRDEGPGLALEEQSRLFGAFQQTAEGKSRGGTGLGLFNVKNLAQRQGGKVWVESEKGKGASFFFTLPAAR